MIAPTPDPDQQLSRACRTAAALLPIAIALPLVLVLWRPPFLGNAHDSWRRTPYELLAAFVAFALVAAGARAIKWNSRAAEPDRQALLPVAAFVVVGIWLTTAAAEFLIPSPDYRMYFRGAMSLTEGLSPYADVRLSADHSSGYIYPPFLAQVMSGGYYLLDRIISRGLGRPGDVVLTSSTLYYLWVALLVTCQCSLFPMCYALLRRVRMTVSAAALCATALVVFNLPRAAAFADNQATLLVFVLSLAVVLAPQRAILAGVALAAGIHLKLSPVVLVPALAVYGYWRTLAVAATFTALAFAIPGSLQAWSEFISVARNLGTPVYYNLSPLGFIWNSASLLGASPRVAAIAGHAGQAAISAALAVWLLQRTWQHGRRRHSYAVAASGSLACGVLMAPIAWLHHYALVTPLALIALASFGVPERPDKWRLLALVLAAIFLLPMFMIFPFPYLRPMATFGLLLLTGPSRHAQTEIGTTSVQK